MTNSMRFLAAVALVASSCAANAQEVRHHARHPAPEGRQIIVRPPVESYLTAGTGAAFGSRNAYVLDTLQPPYRNTIQGLFVGQRGFERLPNEFSVPGSNVPLFTFVGP